MDLIFFLVVVLHSLSSVAPTETTKGNVIFMTHHVGGSQISFPFANPNEVDGEKTFKIKLTEKTKLRIECKDYKNDNPRAFVYTPEGFLLDTLNLAYITQVCDKVDNYVHVSDEPKYDQQNKREKVIGINKQTLAITYLMAGKKPRCIKRKYHAVDFPYMAFVERQDLPIVDCPENLKKIAEGGVSAGGVLNLGPMLLNYVLDYNKNVDSVGDTKEFLFETKDSNGKSFKMKCTEYKLTKELEITKKKRMATAIIVHEDNEQIYLEKFVLHSCDAGVQGININRRPSYHGDQYRMVFKLADGDCMQRDLVKHEAVHLFNYDQTVLGRGEAREVLCPKKWSGDIGLNENVPWYKILYYRRKPFLSSH